MIELPLELAMDDRLTNCKLPCDVVGCKRPSTKLVWVVHPEPLREIYYKTPWKGRAYRTSEPRMIVLCDEHHNHDTAMKLVDLFLNDPKPRCCGCGTLTFDMCSACGMCRDCGCQRDSCPKLQGILHVPPSYYGIVI